MSKQLRLASFVLVAWCVFSCSSQQSQSLSSKNVHEKRTDSSSVELQGDNIPHHKYTLDNGLTVVLHPDISDPLVNVNITYHVGSAREDLGRSGFAHFFEHMMFQGSQHVADEEHFKIITEAGGNLNGSTSSDITNYYQTVPANQLEKVLWLEADRMGFLLPAVTQEKFENQRATVKNERAQRVDNQPYGLRGERTGEALYPEGHPYSWSTIGYVEDLDRVGLADLKAFFKRWYGPNNAVITIGGDIDIAQTKAWIEQYFASIPRGPEVTYDAKQPASLTSTRYITLEDKVHLPLLQVTIPTVYAGHADEAPLDVLADILGGGKTSLLYKNMVKNGYAVQAFAGHPCRELACEFQLLALANPQTVSDLKSLNDIINASLTEFEARGVQDDDLRRVKAGIEAGTIFALQSVDGKVRTLAAGETFYGTPDRVNIDLARYNAVTKEDVLRVYFQYVKNKPAVVLSVVPQGASELAVAEQDFTLEARNIESYAEKYSDNQSANQSEEYSTQAMIIEDFDRSVQPKAGVNKIVSIPEYWQEALPLTSSDASLQVFGIETDETPTITFSISMEGGELLDSLEKIGLASFTAQLMNESTKNFSSEEFANELAVLGSAISVGASGRYTNIYVSTLVKHAEKTMQLLAERLLEPAFNESEFKLLKQRTLQSLQQQLKNPSVLASRARDAVLYGTDTRIGLPGSGTLASVEALTLEDVQAFYDAYYRPDHAKVVVVGDVTAQRTIDLLSPLSTWQSKPYDIPHFKVDKNNTKGNIYLVDNPDAVQSVISIFKHAPVYDAFGEYFKLNLANFPLGGAFNSRINLNLREDKGYTYGARSGFAGGKNLGRFSAGADVNAEFTQQSLVELLNELDRYQSEGMTQEELVFLQSAYTQSDALSYETPRQKASFLSHILAFELDRDYSTKQLTIISNIKREELNELSARWLDTNTIDIVIVGDATSILPQLNEFDREVIAMDVPR